MHKDLSNFAARLLPLMRDDAISDIGFNSLALELFALQFQHNPAYQTICIHGNKTPAKVEHWSKIPAVPASAFKELDLTSLAPAERTAVFHSSGTTEQRPSRHFHCAESLAVYEESLWSSFQTAFSAFRFPLSTFRLACLTPPQAGAPHSSLVHMLETIRRKLNAPESVFVGQLDPAGAWTLDFTAALASLDPSPVTRHPLLIFGTAFSFVHLCDFLAEKNLKIRLSPGSLVMETGGYKNRSRSMPKSELHALITERLGVPRENIVCEYGMSELSSQAYEVTGMNRDSRHPSPVTRHFSFPPWARVQIISPETGCEVADGETGLIRIFDPANVFSVAVVQTEDLGVRRGGSFELIGRSSQAENRGCSLMTA